MKLQLKIQPISDAFTVIAVGVFALSFPLMVKPMVYATWLFCVSCIAAYAAHKKATFRWGYIFPLLFFAIRLVAFLLSDTYKLRDIDSYFSFFILPLAFSLLALSAKQVRAMLLLIFYANVLAATLVLAFFVHEVVIQGGTFWLALLSPKAFYGIFLIPPIHGHPTYLSVILLFTVPLAFYLRYQLKAVGIKAMLMGLIVTLSGVYITGARTAIVVALALLAFTLVFYFRKTSFAIRLAALVLGGAIITLSLLNTNSASDPIRREFIKVGVGAAQEHPWLGSGLRSTKGYIERADFPADMDRSLFNHGHFHCQFIDDWVQFGVAGLLVLVAFFAYCIGSAWRKRDYLLACYAIIWLPFMLIDSPMDMSSVKGIVPITFWFCLLVATQDVRHDLAEGN